MRSRRIGVLAVFLIGFFLGSLPAAGQDWTGEGRQIGYVYDEEGNPLEGVKVKLFFVKTQSGFELETDKEGKWVAMGIKGGAWYVDFEKVGYEPKKISINVLDFRQQNKPIEIQLKKIEGLVITDELKDDFKKGNELFDQGKYDEAIAVFKGIVEAFPSAYVVNLNIGHCYFQKEEYDEAEAFYKKVLEQDPDYVHAVVGIGNCYMNRGDVDKAMEWYNRISFEKLEDPVVLYNVGTVYYNNSKFQDALRYYEKAVEIDEGFLDARYQLGLAFLTLGKNEEAIEQFEAYLVHDAESERASQVRSFLDYLKK